MIGNADFAPDGSAVIQVQEHNICFTTVDRPDENEVAKLTTEAPQWAWLIIVVIAEMFGHGELV